MRRLAAALAAACLTVLLAGTVLAAQPSTAKNSFVGDFDVIDPGTGLVAGHVVARFTVGTERQVAPGSFEFTGASWYPIKSIRAAAANSLFWIDPNGGRPHAELVGAACEIFWPGGLPGGYTCYGTWTVMFREVPNEPNSILFSHCWIGPGEWDFDFNTDTGCAFLLSVGSGGWVLKVPPQ